ncbi:MAG: Fpg/Nei family DNA glycosylase [Acidimicrobiales bacterium]
MPELPEVEALAGDLRSRLASRVVERAEVASIAALRTYAPPLGELVGRVVAEVGRKGKFLLFRTDEPGGGALVETDEPGGLLAPMHRPAGSQPVWLVVHLARAGWVRWRDPLAEARAKPGRGPLVLRLGFAGGVGIEVTEAGTEKRLALWVVTDLGAVAPLASLGPDPLEPGFDLTALAAVLEGQTGQVKGVITDQRVLAGVGNAYSDEALHSARLSPFKQVNRLSPDEVGRLYAGLVGVLSDALARSVGLAASDLKGEKHSGMAVHGRAGLSCPVCGDTIRQVSFATKSLQYCPTCQTGGKVLADRRMSRLVK